MNESKDWKWSNTYPNDNRKGGGIGCLGSIKFPEGLFHCRKLLLDDNELQKPVVASTCCSAWTASSAPKSSLLQILNRRWLNKRRIVRSSFLVSWISMLAGYWTTLPHSFQQRPRSWVPMSIVTFQPSHAFLDLMPPADHRYVYKTVQCATLATNKIKMRKQLHLLLCALMLFELSIQNLASVSLVNSN